MLDYAKIKAIKERLLEIQPYFATILSLLEIQELPSGYPFAIGIGLNREKESLRILINPDKYFKYTEKEQVSLLIHEMFHVLYGHLDVPYPKNPEIQRLTNIAMDISINQMIPNLPKDGMFPETFKFPRGLSWEAYYNLLQSTKKTEGKNSLDSHDFIKDEETAALFKKACINTILRTQQIKPWELCTDDMGSSEIKKTIEVINKTTSQDLLKKILNRSIKQSLDHLLYTKSYSRQSKRYEGYAGNVIEEKLKMLVSIDVSGSIPEWAIGCSLDVVAKLSKSLGVTVDVNTWDTSITSEFSIHNSKDLAALQIVGGGGTDITPVFDLLQTRKYDLVLIITDGYFVMPAQKPKNKLLWLLHNPVAQWTEGKNTIYINKAAA